jgi:hypothetical protein
MCIKKKVCLSVKGGLMLVLAMAVAINVASNNVLHVDSALPLYLGRKNSSKNSNEKLRVRKLHMWETVHALEAGSIPHFCAVFKVKWWGVCRGGGEAVVRLIS